MSLNVNHLQMDYSGILSPGSDVLLCRPRGNIGRSKVALMECTDLIGLESTNDRMEHATVMEHNKVTLLPIVWIHQLHSLTLDQNVQRDRVKSKYLRRNGGPLHRVQKLANYSKILDMHSIWV